MATRYPLGKSLNGTDLARHFRQLADAVDGKTFDIQQGGMTISVDDGEASFSEGLPARKTFSIESDLVLLEREVTTPENPRSPAIVMPEWLVGGLVTLAKAIEEGGLQRKSGDFVIVTDFAGGTVTIKSNMVFKRVKP